MCMKGRHNAKLSMDVTLTVAVVVQYSKKERAYAQNIIINAM